MATVNWEWTLLATTLDMGSSHRVARRGAAAFTSLNSGVDDAPGSPPIWMPGQKSAAPDAYLDAQGRQFIFAFWHVRGGTTGGMSVGSSILPIRDGFSIPVGADGNTKATAYYVYDFGSGPGPNAIFLDAFDQDTGFFAEDFVTVSPWDPILYSKANNGYIDTQTDITGTEPPTLTAFNPGAREFSHWIEIKNLTFPANSGPKVGRPQKTDISEVTPGCRLVAFAVYTSTQAGLQFPGYYPGIYDIWWRIPTRGGLVPGPPDPLGPWLQQLVVETIKHELGKLTPK